MNFEYDVNGNKISEYRTDFDFSYTYNVLNRLIQKTDNNLNKTISYTYDDVGKKVSCLDI